MWLPLFGFVIGFACVYLSKLQFPLAYAKYVAIAIIAGLDAVIGGVRSAVQGRFNDSVFLIGFFSNTLLAGLLAWIGDLLGMDLALAAVVAFGVRIFQNLAQIRYDVYDRLAHKRESSASEPP